MNHSVRHLLSTFFLGPLLLIQGMWVRKTIPDLPEPEGSRSGIAGQGEKLRLLILGDSAAAGVGVDHQDQALTGLLVEKLSERYCVEWRLEAASGATTADTLERLACLDAGSYEVVITSLGVNDVLSSIGIGKWLQQQKQLRTMLQDSFGVARLIVSGLPPMGLFPALPQPLRWYLGRRAEQLDAALEQDLQGEPGVEYLDLEFVNDMSLMAEDGFHPGPLVYREWADNSALLILNSRKGAGYIVGKR